MIVSWLFDDRPNALADRYRALIGPAPVIHAFQAVMELRFGAAPGLSGATSDTAASRAESPD